MPPAPAWPPTWTETTYVIPASHPRGYVRGVRNPQTDRLRLSVTRYTPADGGVWNAPPGTSTSAAAASSAATDAASAASASASGADAPALSLLVTHGMPPTAHAHSNDAFLWDLLHTPALASTPIRAIYTHDVAGFGASYDLNAAILGDSPHVADTARDLAAIVSALDLREPVVAVGNSWGCIPTVLAAAGHARLFAGLVLVEPAGAENGWFHEVAAGTTRGAITRTWGALWLWRREAYRDWEEVRRLAAGPEGYMGQLDPRVRELLVRHDFREEAYVDEKGVEGRRVRWHPPKAQVVPHFLRPGPALAGQPEDPEWATRTEDTGLGYPGFYSVTMSGAVREAVRGLWPPTLFVWGKEERPWVSTAEYRERLAGAAGTGWGGGGGEFARWVGCA